MQTVIFDADLIHRYDKSGPRYTSYPTALQFHEGFTEKQHSEAIFNSNEEPVPPPLSLYVHLPFCNTVCFYCACTKIVTANKAHSVSYLNDLFKEIELQAKLFDPDRSVTQMHWGGGTPTFFSQSQLTELMQHIRTHFNLVNEDKGEYSIEIDPRGLNEKDIEMLRECGFNRISMGVQDFDPEVQKAVNRIQSEEATTQIIEAARTSGFRSINLDLIYGLPKQSVESFNRTLDKVLALSPDRLSIFNYAHLPERFKSQRQINQEDLPSVEEKLAIYKSFIERLQLAGYEYIGMDHFSKPEDELALAQKKGELTRNFQGYSTHGTCDMLGLGLSSISQIGDCYSQNCSTLEGYSKAIQAGKIPVYRGIKLDNDDLLRRHVISQLICHFYLSFDSVEELFHIKFSDYFYNELNLLTQFQDDQLIEMDPQHIKVLANGRLLIRNICMVFDKYLRQSQSTNQYSRVI